jgi:hypothetical protein
LFLRSCCCSCFASWRRHPTSDPSVFYCLFVFIYRWVSRHRRLFFIRVFRKGGLREGLGCLWMLWCLQIFLLGFGAREKRRQHGWRVRCDRFRHRPQGMHS